ncbi:MAG TPA: alpha/beta hydrolase domain-containing protein [Xanthobacteraceae bacterium]|jgi:hypothetical protein
MKPTTCIAVCAALLATAQAAQARVTTIKITRIESPTFEGRSFGDVGRYEKLLGRLSGELDPADPHNSIITDITLAPRNARGRVQYETDIMILRPLDPSKGNHKVWYEITNRGSIPSFHQFNDARSGGNDPSKAADSGNGFLMRQGYVIVTSGWDISAPPGDSRFTIKAPVAVNPDGSPIVGPAMEEFVIDAGDITSRRLSYPPATLDRSQARLTKRVRVEDEPAPVEGWDYANPAGTAIKLAADKPFEQGTLYEFFYPAKNPVVAGIGFAAVRDFASFLRHAAHDDDGNDNPAGGQVTAVYTGCVSQPCRMMHDFVWLGFNADESGNKVIDGIVNWIGGATGIFMNYRFAQPFRTQRQHIARWYPEFQFPFTNQIVHDPITGKSDGRLARCLSTETCPKIFEVNSANEYWSKDMAAGLVDPKGNDYTDEPANVRSYFMASLPHQGGFGGTARGICQQNRNPLVANPVLRALLVAMDNWVSTGTEPPASRVPHVADGTLVTPLPQSQEGFPNIPGVKYTGRMHTGDLFDFGPKFDVGILSVLPPHRLGTPYPALVPKTDADGNDVAGIRLPEVAVPVATYAGWNLRALPPGGDEGCDAAGQMIAFAKDKAERVASGDPRPSIEERYPGHIDYVNRVTAAAEALVRDRLLLDEDVAAYVRKAQNAPVGN